MNDTSSPKPDTDLHRPDKRERAPGVVGEFDPFAETTVARGDAVLDITVNPATSGQVFTYRVGRQKLRAHGTWYRGDTVNYAPVKANFIEDSVIEDYFLHGWAPPAPFIYKTTPITAFGSCFAANISKFLSDRHFNVLSRGDIDAYIATCGEGMVNSFVIRQQFEWALEGKAFSENLWFDYKGTLAAYDEKVRASTRHVFLQSDVFIITLGLSEIWYNKITGDAFWRAIPVDRFDDQKHGFKISTVAENLENLERIYRIIREKRGAEAKIVFTLSPVPLAATFRPVSCITADAVSKATLRVAIDELMRAHANDSALFYFPAYEIVTRAFVDPYTDDLRHPKSSVIEFVMHVFFRHYCGGEGTNS